MKDMITFLQRAKSEREKKSNYLFLNVLLTFLLFASSWLMPHFSNAQEDKLTKVWEKKYYASWTFSPGMDSIMLFSTSKFYFVDGKTGLIIWEKKYSELNPKLKSSIYYNVLWNDNYIFICQNKKLGVDRFALVDLKSGNLIWYTDRFRIRDVFASYDLINMPEHKRWAISFGDSLVLFNSETHEIVKTYNNFKGYIAKYVYLKDRNMLILINYQPKKSVIEDFRKMILCINPSNGEIYWENSYEGNIFQKIITWELMVDLWVKDERVFLNANGLHVYDLKTGKKLVTSITYPDIQNKKGDFPYAIVNAVAPPIVTNNSVYVIENCDFGKYLFIKKYDLHTGELKWSSGKIENIKILPVMYLTNGLLVLQVGGLAEKEYFFTYNERTGSGYVTKRKDVHEYTFVDPFAIMALDTSNGKVKWQLKKFKQRFLTLVDSSGRLFAVDENNLYIYNTRDGEEILSFSLEKDGVGKPLQMKFFENNLIIACSNGITCHSMSNGSFLWKSTPFHENPTILNSAISAKIINDVAFIMNGTGKTGIFDIKTGNFLGTTRLNPFLFDLIVSPDGHILYQQRLSRLTRFKIK